MARNRKRKAEDATPVISIIGPGMALVGDCRTEGSIRIEGRVEGTVRAGKAVVVGREGRIDGDLESQDAVIAGRVKGSVTAASRLELHETARIDGRVSAGSLKLAEGAILNGEVAMGREDAEGLDGAGAPPSSRESDGARRDDVPAGIA